MLALSVRPPFAQLIIDGIKKIENRTWVPRKYGEAILCQEIVIHQSGPNGAGLGIVNILEFLRPNDAIKKMPDQKEYISGPWCWVLRVQEKWDKPIPAKGKLGLWDWDGRKPQEAK